MPRVDERESLRGGFESVRRVCKLVAHRVRAKPSGNLEQRVEASQVSGSPRRYSPGRSAYVRDACSADFRWLAGACRSYSGAPSLPDGIRQDLLDRRGHEAFSACVLPRLTRKLGTRSARACIQDKCVLYRPHCGEAELSQKTQGQGIQLRL